MFYKLSEINYQQQRYTENKNVVYFTVLQNVWRTLVLIFSKIGWSCYAGGLKIISPKRGRIINLKITKILLVSMLDTLSDTALNSLETLFSPTEFCFDLSCMLFLVLHTFCLMFRLTFYLFFNRNLSNYDHNLFTFNIWHSLMFEMLLIILWRETI